MRVCLIGAVTLALLSSVALAAPSSAPSSVKSADAQLQAIYTEHWAWWKKEQAEEADDERPGNESGHLPRVDAASQDDRSARLSEVLAQVNQLSFAQLSPEEKVNAQIFRTLLEERIADLRFKTYQAPFNADSFFWTEFTPREGYSDLEEYRRYLGRLADVPRFFDEHTANMRAGLARGFTVPKVSVIGRDKTLEPYLATDETNPLYQPFRAMPAGMAKDEQERLKSEARTLRIADSTPSP